MVSLGLPVLDVGNQSKRCAKIDVEREMLVEENPILRFHQRLPSFRLERDHTPLIAIDMQYYNAHPEHGMFAQGGKDEFAYYFTRLKTVISNIKALQETFREK